MQPTNDVTVLETAVGSGDDGDRISAGMSRVGHYQDSCAVFGVFPDAFYWGKDSGVAPFADFGF